MDSKELRIGNKLQYYTSTVEIIAIQNEYLAYWNDEYGESELVWNFINDFQPIPISEEWLLKFDAEKSVEFKNVRQYYLDEIKIEIDLTTGEMFWTNKEPGGWKPLKYVHTLQNIYFILSETGEELTIKEKQF